MTDINFKKEYNNTLSNKKNMDVFNICINDRSILQYGSKYLEKKKEFKKMFYFNF